MNADYIRELIRNGVKVKDMSQDAALAEIGRAVTTTYIVNGLQRQLTPEGFTQEIQVATRALYSELVTDPAYESIRIGEVAYLFGEGTKGRLGTDKDIVVTAKTLLRWLEGYLAHDERREAMAKVIADRYVEPQRQIATQRVYTDDDIRKRINDAYVAYVEYLWRKAQPPKTGPQRIGECVEPYLIRDLGGRCMEYLIRNGYASEGEEFRDVLERMRKNQGQLTKQNQ